MNKSFYPNLVKAMKEKGVTKTDLAAVLDVHFNTVTDKIEAKTTSESKTYNIGFTFIEALMIRKIFFKEYDIEWLFDCEAINTKAS